VEAEALEEIKLVDIEHKKHDPYQLVSRYLMHYNMKAYEHEKSVYDDIFKEVLNMYGPYHPNYRLVSCPSKVTGEVVCQKFCRVNPRPLLQSRKGLPQALKQMYRIKKIQREK
jgi:hypothetical protein